VELGGLLICFYSEPRVTLSPPSSNQKPLRELLSQQCAACAASLLEQHGIDVLIALGRYDLGGFALHTNYLSAKALLEQAMCSRLPDNVVLDAAELTKKTDPEFSGAQRQFYNCFTCFQFSAAAEHLYHMVELRIQGYYDSFQEAKEVVAQQLRFCTNMLELPLNVSLSLEDGSRISIRDLMASPDAQALRENLYRYFSGLERQVSGTSAQAAPTTDRVRSYIENHYADPEISVSSVSQQFHLNVSYLSRQFKQEYGCGVLEFIHRLRISQAKELMSAGVQLSQVFSSVGYTSRRAFDSAFHRYEGITPKAYQDQLVAGKVS
jgi:AraC-like DNA-binding protein